ncbi:MAG: response regulator transcription factor [Burkholderiaceae bacterium]|nr:response regulator transcription factor [Rhodoferax sp.]MCB2005072.1 response regulator transcription factor [Rhodoferax sp.]MCB2043346.1 response regulator transcription factor [Rhodoferax sp.]
MLTAEPIQVMVLYQDPLVRAGLAATLAEHTRYALVPAEASCVGPAGLSPDLTPDVVVTDYDYGLQLLARSPPQARSRPGEMPVVLIVTPRDTEWEIRHALACGARGYLVLGCGVNELVEAVRTVHRGMRHIGAQAARRLADSIACSPLTSRETDVLRLVVEGQGNKAIARELAIANGTVKSHLKAIFEKLDARSRTEVAAVAERRGLLAVGPAAPDRSVFTPQVRHAATRLRPSMLASRLD